MGAMDPLVIALVVLGLVALWAVVAFNRLVALRQRCENGWSQIDIQLRRRADLIPNLVETVRGYAQHERELFERVTEARVAGDAARSVGERSEAERRVDAGLKQLIAVAEAYPDLKADEGFRALQEELSGTESKIAYARQFYNDQVMLLNTRIGAFPSSLIARLFRFSEREFFEADEDARSAVRVEL